MYTTPQGNKVAMQISSQIRTIRIISKAGTARGRTTFKIYETGERSHKQ
jgi:hypothetical protein